MVRQFLLAAAMMMLGGDIAVAHAFLEHASPGAGTVLSAAPKAVTLDYSEDLEPSFSTVVVTDAGGRSVTAAPSMASGTRMTVPLKALAPGTYRVKWRALSVDTHRTEGSFAFNVKP